MLEKKDFLPEMISFFFVVCRKTEIEIKAQKMLAFLHIPYTKKRQELEENEKPTKAIIIIVITIAIIICQKEEEEREPTGRPPFRKCSL